MKQICRQIGRDLFVDGVAEGGSIRPLFSRRAALGGAATVAVCATSLRAIAAEPELRLTLGTATPGGGFEQYAAALIAALRGADPELHVEPRHTKGSTENVPLMEQGALDLGFVTGEVTHEALSGAGRAPARLSIVSAMYSTAGMFAVRADSSYRTVEDLKGKSVIFGARGSGLVVLARYVLDALGLDMTRDFDAILLDRVSDAPGMIADGRAVALWGGGQAWPAFTAVTRAAGGARFIAPADEETDRVLARQPFLKRVTLPAGSYPGQSQPITSVGSWSFVLAGPSLTEAAGYRFARTLHRAEGALGEKLAQARETTAANTVAAVPSRDMLLPGVARYLREAGRL